MFPVIAMQRFDFKNSTIAIKLFHVMILNLYLSSEWSKTKSDFVVAVLQRGHRMPIFHKLVWFFRVFSVVMYNNNLFTLSKTSDSFLCISLYMLMSSAHPAPLFRGFVWRFTNNHKKYKVWDLLLLEVQLDHEQWVLINPWVLTF